MKAVALHFPTPAFDQIMVSMGMILFALLLLG